MSQLGGRAGTGPSGSVRVRSSVRVRPAWQEVLVMAGRVKCWGDHHGVGWVGGCGSHREMREGGG